MSERGWRQARESVVRCFVSSNELAKSLQNYFQTS